MIRAEEAKADFLGGHQCCQAVLSTFAADAGLPADVAIRIATAFGAGMGRQSQACGAVSGALMVIGLFGDETGPVDLEAREKVYADVVEFCRRFRERRGSIGCTELLGVDLATAEGKTAHKERLRNTLCADLVADAVSILESMGYGAKRR